MSNEIRPIVYLKKALNAARGGSPAEVANYLGEYHREIDREVYEILTKKIQETVDSGLADILDRDRLADGATNLVRSIQMLSDLLQVRTGVWYNLKDIQFDWDVLKRNSH